MYTIEVVNEDRTIKFNVSKLSEAINIGNEIRFLLTGYDKKVFKLDDFQEGVVSICSSNEYRTLHITIRKD